jgi:SAM-dependent methyltransferase/uncharacterized protein YbaR (Trm112 family)
MLNFIVCPVSKTELSCLVTKEAGLPIPHLRLTECDRINQPGAMFGPVPRFGKSNWLTEFLQSNACPAAPSSRNYEVVVEEGLLISGETGRWYPIRNFVPELLPDHLRNFEQDLEFLSGLRDVLPPALFERLYDRKLFSGRTETDDIAEKYKRAEMAIPEKVDPSFFLPGETSPFNPWDAPHSVHLIRLFSFCLGLLLRNWPNQVVLDAGCGYSWTTEWLLKSGFEPIGVDITRAYLDIAVTRLGAWLPYLAVADTEHLPIRSGAMDAVLCYEAFHHIPNRRKAMQQFFSVLKPGKSVIFAEPGSNHEHAQGSIDVMQKYGILERGMNLEDVQGYVRGSGFLEPAEHHVLELDASTATRASLSNEFLSQHGFSATNLFTIDKPLETVAKPQPTATERVRSVMRGIGLLPK